MRATGSTMLMPLGVQTHEFGWMRKRARRAGERKAPPSTGFSPGRRRRTLCYGVGRMQLGDGDIVCFSMLS